jgi:hypothetical protein
VGIGALDLLTDDAIRKDLWWEVQYLGLHDFNTAETLTGERLSDLMSQDCDFR